MEATFTEEKRQRFHVQACKNRSRNEASCKAQVRLENHLDIVMERDTVLNSRNNNLVESALLQSEPESPSSITLALGFKSDASTQFCCAVLFYLQLPSANLCRNALSK
jgi:hypothetical protein